MLYRVFERLIVKAHVDHGFRAALLAEPRSAAMAAGYSVFVAEALVGLPHRTLAEFAAALEGRLYQGESKTDALAQAHAAPLLVRALG